MIEAQQALLQARSQITQLAERLTSYARYRGQLANDRALTQDDVDRAYRALHDQDRAAAPKGQSSATSRLVRSEEHTSELQSP